MIRIGGLFPKHLNLNGDFGNLEVLIQQLQWRGLESELVAIETVDDLTEQLDFIFVGHGSDAAWADLKSGFEAFTPALKSLIDSGTPGLAVSSGFEHSVRAGLFGTLSLNTLSSRVSKFIVHEDGANEVLGYLNTDLDLPIVYRQSNWIATMLHGPVLAKNPLLLHEVLNHIASHAGMALPEIQESEKAGQLADLIEEVWKLERELAGE
jgi:CobQ-like glutamine amidotransferase family enzyme